MKSLKEIFLELLSETTLCEMALERKEALLLCTHSSFQIVRHFIKVYLFPDHRDYSHWRYEIANWLEDINEIDLKPNNKKLKFEDLYRTLYDQPIGHTDAVKNMIAKMVERNRIPYIKNVNYELLHSKLESMYHQLCIDLSINQMKNINYYIDMLEEI